MELVYADDRLVVCVKPAGVKSTDEPGGVPELVRRELGEPAGVVRTVHRLDQAVGGLMVLARTARAAAELSEQIRQGSFEKAYLAVVHGQPQPAGRLQDLLYRDRARRMTRIAAQPGKEVREAILDYRVMATAQGMSRVHIQLHTGRTHQIRVQFSSRGFPLAGDKKYGHDDLDCPIALWSHSLSFRHPRTGEQMRFVKEPPDIFPWNTV